MGCQSSSLVVARSVPRKSNKLACNCPRWLSRCSAPLRLRPATTSTGSPSPGTSRAESSMARLPLPRRSPLISSPLNSCSKLLESSRGRGPGWPRLMASRPGRRTASSCSNWPSPGTKFCAISVFSSALLSCVCAALAKAGRVVSRSSAVSMSCSSAARICSHSDSCACCASVAMRSCCSCSRIQPKPSKASVVNSRPAATIEMMRNLRVI